jgi:cell division inhibitor SepF
MSKFGKKFLSFIGFEDMEGEEEMYFEDDENLQEDMIDFNEETYEQQEDEKQRFGKKNSGKIVGLPDAGKVRVLIYKPLSYEDTQSIIDNLKERKSIVVNLDELEVGVAQRILDFISGAVYALNGNIRKAARNIFVVAPFNVDLTTNASEAGDDYAFKYVDRE